MLPLLRIGPTPLKLKPNSLYLKKTSTKLTLAQSKALHAHGITPPLLPPPSPKQIQEVHKLDIFESGYSQSNHHKQDF